MNQRLIFLLIITCLLAYSFAEPTQLSYIIEVQEEDQKDFIEMTIKVTAEDESLTVALAQAKQKATKMKGVYQQICKKLIKDKSSCKEAVEIGNVEIEPSYKQQKKETIYDKITVSYEVVITIKEMKFLGDLVDEMTKIQGIVIDSVEGVPDQDKEENQFIAESMEKSKALCQEIGKQFIQVTAVEELREEPEEPEEEEPAEEGEEEEEEEEEPEEQPEEEEEEVTAYRITILCDGKAVKAKKAKK